MQTKAWRQAWRTCADPERARRAAETLAAADPAVAERLPAVTAEQARVLAALFSGSVALSESLCAHPDWLDVLLDVEGLRFPRAVQGLRREVETWLTPALEQREFEGALRRLRRFKARELLRIGARDLAGLGEMTQITRELSDVADVCWETVYQVCWRRLTERLGRPWHQTPENEWRPTPFAVLGLGKLGGRELNYSSDVDVMFVYEEEGFVFRRPPGKRRRPGEAPAAHDFFRRLAQALVDEVRRLTPEGQLYRVDLRLRPEGPAGPLARSLTGYETYYAQYGQTWERMMLIKARGVAGDRTLAAEFLEMIQPFRYPRLLGPRFLHEIASMKHRTEREVVRSGELERNVKLGRGGIREIEFIAQTLQVLNAGRLPFLANPQTLPTLAALVRYKLLRQEEADDLTAAYRFLRNVEHRLQMEHNRQTHSLPEDDAALERLAKLMGFPKRKDFLTTLTRHRDRVREIYEQTVPGESPTGHLLPRFEGDEERWRERLRRRSFRDPEQALRLAKTFVHGPGFALVTPRTEELARELLGHFLRLCPREDDLELRRKQAGPDGDPRSRWLSDPDRVLARLDSYVTAYGARATLFESWTANPALFELLLLLFDRSEFLAETALAEVDLVESLQLSGRLRQSKTAADTLRDLRHGRDDPDQSLWLRQYHRAEFMRIGLRDILGLADAEQSLVELSALAEACLQYALEVVLRKRRYRRVPVAIIGLGKLGGAELNYGSDLDVIFVAGDRERDVSRLQKIAVEVMDLVGAQTEAGSVFEVDARLRPDGESGRLVTTVAAAGDYYRRRAWLWELQALSRARCVAGNAEVGKQFLELVAEVADFRAPDPDRVAAQKPGWRREIVRMRQRIERERVKPGHDALALKTGAGGLMDVEFLAQALCLEHGWLEPNTRRALERACADRAQPCKRMQTLIEHYRKLRRVEAILRRWSYEGESELPEDDAARYRVAVRCGFATTGDFMAAVARYRRAIRREYARFFARELKES